MNISDQNITVTPKPRNKTKGILFGMAAICVTLISTGCTSISYRPEVSLGESPRTIRASVMLNQFVDKCPQDDKSDEPLGDSACAPGTLQGDLATDVTDAILTDFNNNQVFETIKKRYDAGVQPDLIMDGTINRFSGKFRMDALGWCTLPIDIVWLFGLPIMDDKGMIDLSVTISRPDGTVLGTYHGQAAISDYYNMYENAELGLPTRMNNAFSDAVSQIRAQIVKDEPKLTSIKVTSK